MDIIGLLSDIHSLILVRLGIKKMTTISSNSDNKLLVITSLTGTDQQMVLNQTKGLQPPVPSKGSPNYQVFLKNFLHSPANNISTIANFLREQAKWEINSVENYQNYLNLFNNAPFLVGYSSSNREIKKNYNSVCSLLSGIYAIANVPTQKQDNEYGLKKFLHGDFENAPKNLTIITQNLQATEGQLILSFTKSNFIISYFPPQGINISRKPTYKISVDVDITTCTVAGPLYFEQNGEQFLGLGFINVTDWITETSTPISIQEKVIFQEKPSAQALAASNSIPSLIQSHQFISQAHTDLVGLVRLNYPTLLSQTTQQEKVVTVVWDNSALKSNDLDSSNIVPSGNITVATALLAGFSYFLLSGVYFSITGATAGKTNFNFTYNGTLSASAVQALLVQGSNITLV